MVRAAYFAFLIASADSPAVPAVLRAVFAAGGEAFAVVRAAYFAFLIASADSPASRRHRGE